MKVVLVTALVVVAQVLVVVTLKFQSTATEMRHAYGSGDKGEAYVTLLNGYNLLSVRVLGLSLKLTGTRRKMIVLCADEVSIESRKILEGDGWTVKSIKTTYRLHKDYLERFDKHYTKLSVWTLTEYRRIWTVTL